VATEYYFSSNAPELSFRQKLLHFNWPLLILLCMTGAVGVAMLYSAANGNWAPWATRQLARFSFSVLLLFAVGLTDIRIWLRFAYPIYAVALALLVAVELIGATGMGAQRWISLGIFNLQPSEVMKIASVLALARYFHSATLEDVGRPLYLIVPVAMILGPAALVLKQPDLGTAIMLIAAGGAVLFAVGVRLWKFAIVLAAGLGAMPVVWSMLRPYQQRRIYTFLDPESDPLGAGYHILQSKIALGSGGLFGKGFMKGTQSHLNFLPEKQTDFIFTMLAEEFGLAGGLALLALYMLLIIYGFAISLRSRNQFGRILGIGLTVTVSLYVFINVAMVMGLVPVVGVPLPLISYGGTAMLSVMIAFGLLISISIHRDILIGRHGETENF
jgi:rod shape determining protein RodA